MARSLRPESRRFVAPLSCHWRRGKGAPMSRGRVLGAYTLFISLALAVLIVDALRL
jgi:hypothetical protein